MIPHRPIQRTYHTIHQYQHEREREHQHEHDKPNKLKVSNNIPIPPSTSTLSTSSSSSSITRIPTLLTSLIRSILGDSSNDTTTTTSLCLRILASRIGHNDTLNTLTQQIDTIKTLIDPSQQQQVNDLLHHYVHHVPLNEKQRLLHFLVQCRSLNTSTPYITSYLNRPIDGTLTSSSSQHNQYNQYNQNQLNQSNNYHHSNAQPVHKLTKSINVHLSGGGRHPVPDVMPDAEIARALLYVFQGVDSTLVKLDSMSASTSQNNYKQAYRINDGITGITQSRKQMILKICDIGILYRRICSYINEVLDKRDKQNSISVTRRGIKKLMSNGTQADIQIGLICQSLVGALQSELGDYYRWIAMLESQLNDSPQTFTLRRLYISSQPPFRRLIQLAMLVDEAANQHGGSLLSLIYSHCQHGDMTIRIMMRSILDASTTPLLSQIDRWIQTGEVMDPHEEFFVSVNIDAQNDKLWTDKYSLRTSMIPSFMSPRLVHEILVIGKSVNFIRQCCDQPQFTAKCTLSMHDLIDVDSLQLAGRTISSSDPASSSVSQTLLNCASVVNNHLLSLILGEQHQLLLHTGALKSFLLLAQGDFIQSLFDVIANDLSKPANLLNNRALQVHVDVAVRASNARFALPDVLRRLGVKLLRGEGDSGWDVFSLDYTVENPLSVIITPDQMRIYLRLFNFLWRLKRAEYELVNLWSRHMSCRSIIAKSLGSMPAFVELERVLRIGHFMRNELHHLVKNVHSFMMLEVIESSYQSFAQAVAQAQSLDALILAHAQYVDMLADKALLQGPSTALSRPLLILFDDAMKFVRLQDRIYDEAMREVAKRESFAVNAQRIRVTPTQTAEVSRRESFNEAQQHEISERLSRTSAAVENAAQLLDSGVFVDLLPTFEGDVRSSQISFYDHLEYLILVLDQEIAKANHAEAVSQEDEIFDGPGQQSPINSNLVQELEFLRFRLDFSEFYARRSLSRPHYSSEVSPVPTESHDTEMQQYDSKSFIPSRFSRLASADLRQHDEYL